MADKSLKIKTPSTLSLMLGIAYKHLIERRRQSLVSLTGIVLGVAFFLGVASLMRGSEKDFLKRLVDNSPHITVEDQFRKPSLQPLEILNKKSIVKVLKVKPLTEIRGIRTYREIIAWARKQANLEVGPVLEGSAIVNNAGQQIGITLNGMVPEDIKKLTTVEKYMRQGSVENLAKNTNGILIGAVLAEKLSLLMGDLLTLTAASGRQENFKIVGIFRFGRSSTDERQTYVTLKRAQTLLERPDRINTLIFKLKDPFEAYDVSKEIEARFAFKSVSWQENSEDIMNTIKIRNIIMYAVVSAVLLVAVFGIYNVISTVVMEKLRDIAIMRSMGFSSKDIKQIFLLEGALLGSCGTIVGLLLGVGLMTLLMGIRLKTPGSSDITNLPIDWGWEPFVIAGGAAFFSALLASFIPARHASRVMPVDILRGGF